MGRIIPALAICATTFAATPATAQNGESGAALLVPPAPYDSETRPSPPSPHIIQIPQVPQPPQVTQVPEPPSATPALEPRATTSGPGQQPVAQESAQDKAPEPVTTGGIDKASEEKKPAEAAEAASPVPADKPAAAPEATPTATAEPKPAIEAKPQAGPEAKPGDTVEAKPGTPVETKPAAGAEINAPAATKPPATVEAKPAAPEVKPNDTVEAKPGSPAEAKPSDTAETKPDGAVESKPGATAEITPSAPAEPKQNDAAEAKPNGHAEPKQNGVAEAKPTDSPDGRFTFSRMNDGYVRLDNRTGQVSFCGKRSVGWTCQLAPDDRGALDNEIARLQEENVILKRDLLGRGLPLPGTVKPEPQPRVSQNERAPFSLPHDPNIERMKVMVEKMWRQLVDMITALQKDVLKKS